MVCTDSSQLDDSDHTHLLTDDHGYKGALSIIENVSRATVILLH